MKLPRGISAFPLLVGAAVRFPAPRGRTLTNNYRSLSMQSDPLLATVLAKLNSIEASIEKLAAHVAVQNGRIGKLEKAQAEEQAVTEHIEREIDARNDRADRRSHVWVGALGACAAVFGGVIAVVVEGLL